jgi:hypothetical protein
MWLGMYSGRVRGFAEQRADLERGLTGVVAEREKERGVRAGFLAGLKEETVDRRCEREAELIEQGLGHERMMEEAMVERAEDLGFVSFLSKEET